MTDNTMLNAALRYADRGWHVFPLHGIVNGRCTCGTACGKSAGKHPRTPNGFMNASDDPDQITQWWTTWPDANIGIRTGERSRLWVIDQDAKRLVDAGGGVFIPEGENSIRTVEQRLGQELPETLAAQTGSGGWHYYYDYPQDGRTHGSRGNILPGVDIRGEGGYVVAPPSLHESGRRYAWLDESEPISEAPEWFLDIQRIDQKEPFEVKDRVAEGGRNTYLTSYAGSLRRDGYDGDMLRSALLGHNRLVCSPPLEDAEVLQIAEHIMRYPIGAPAMTLINDLNGEVDKSGPKAVVQDPGSLAISFLQFMSDPPEPKEPIVFEGLLDREDGFILAGQSGVGKSWLGMDLALSVASGTPWMGEFATNPGPVVYIDEEGSRSGMYRRMSMLLKGRGITDYNLPIGLVIRRSLKLDNREGLAAISRVIWETRPSLVLMDTLVRMHSGEENSAKDMARFFDMSSQLRQAYGVAVGFIHHTRKPSKEDTGDLADMMRGSGDIRGWPDTIWIARKSDDGIEFHHAKSREHREHEPVLVRNEIDEEAGVAKLSVVSGVRRKALTTEEVRESMVDLIKTLQVTSPVTPALLAGQMDLSVNTVRDHLAALVASGAVSQLPRGSVGAGSYVVPERFLQRSFGRGQE